MNHLGFAVFCLLVVSALAWIMPGLRITWADGVVLGEVVGALILCGYVVLNENLEKL